MFDLKKAKIYQALKWERFFWLVKILKKIFFVLFIVIFLLFLYGFVPENFSQETNRSLLGFSIISLVLFLGCWWKEIFFNLKIKNPQIAPEEENLAEFLSFEVAKAAASAKPLYSLLKNNPKLKFIFSRLLLDFGEVKTELKKVDIDRVSVISEAIKIAQQKNHPRVEIGDALSAFAKKDLVFKRILSENNLKSEDIDNLTWWLENIEEKIKKRKRFWDYENLAKEGTLAKEWTAGYTLTLDKYSIDWTQAIRKSLPEVIGHEAEIRIMERILSRREINNVLLVGEPGTGRKSMIYALAKKSLLGQSLPEVNYKRIVELDMTYLISDITDPDELEKVLDRIFQETITAGNIILVINEFHNYVGQAVRPGVIDISGVISPYLQLPQFQIVAVTNYDGLHRYIEKSSSLLALFEKVEVSQILPRETLMLLENLTLVLEKKYKLFISYSAIREVVSLTERYMPSLPFPEKAMEMLDEVVVYVSSSTKDKVVLPKHVAKIISEKTEIPVGEMEEKEKEILLNLENLLHQRIINQEEAVTEVSTALRRARSEITIRKGPIGCFLFLGPTGVGKTETSKALAEFYYGSEEKMIRLDMSEFQDAKDIPRLIGSSEEPGVLATAVRENPFSLVLLDEIEKANSNILNLFLQVLDEGHLTDGFGRKVSFQDTIIIATSNAGYKVILKALKAKNGWQGVKQKLLDELFEQEIFRPEFINRFDAVVVFKPLSKENLLDIAQLLLSKLKKNLEEKGIELVITEALKEKIVELGYSPVFGAREMRRVIQDKVENILASALLSGKLKRGNRVIIEPKDFKLIINPLLN